MPWRAAGAPTGETVEAAVLCQPDSTEVSAISIVSYGDQQQLRDAWAAHADAIRPQLEEVADACQTATPGVGRWGFGRLACWVEEGSARLSWTDSRGRLLGTIQGVGRDIGALHAWWQENARPLGRAVARATASPQPDAVPPLVRVPGAPDAVVCTSLDEPIVDVHGRSWGIERVHFRSERGYERVVFDLERVGRIRPGGGAQVTVERMPVSEVESQVPGASPPRRGRLALVVRMDGVMRAPDLQRYHPADVVLVRELSIERGPGSRTAIISLAGEGCYQVRIPIFGEPAGGDEDRAAIYIDTPR